MIARSVPVIPAAPYTRSGVELSPRRCRSCPRPATALLAGLVVLSLACRSAPPPIKLAPSQELSGVIQPALTEVQVGQDIVVDYLIRNRSAQPLVCEVADAPEDPGLPFQAYSFNAHLEGSPGVPLALRFLGAPLVGRVSLEPGGTAKFQRATWRAERPGVYVLTFALEWGAGQLVAFEPVTIRVGLAGGPEAPGSGSPAQPPAK